MTGGVEEVIKMSIQFLELEPSKVSECLCESIRRTGVIIPLIVRRQGERYQVVLGRARLQAALIVGMEKVPVIIRKLNDNEVQLLQTEEAVTQRGFQDRKLSERVAMVGSYYMLVKSQGIRMDLIQKVRELTEELPYKAVREQYDSSAYVKSVFGISRRTLNRYMRLQNVCQKVMEYLDDGKLSLRSAVELSYLSKVQQEQVMQIVQEQSLTLKYEQAALLRKIARIGAFGKADVLQLLTGTRPKGTYIKVDRLVVKYGLSNCNQSDLYSLVDNALSCYLKGGH